MDSNSEDQQRGAILSAVQELCTESPGGAQVTATEIAVRAGTNPEWTVAVLFDLDAAGMINFHQSGAGYPDGSFVTCPCQATESG